MSPRKSAAEAHRTRERIVERGVAMASVDGLGGLTIGRLAGDLGISKSGLLGHFGTKEALQLAALRRASEVFSRAVWEPASGAEPGLARLRAVCEAWTTYLERERATFPGGCLFTTAAVEFDAQLPGPVRDAVVRLHQTWRHRLLADVRHAVAAGELPGDGDPEQYVFELLGIFFSLNHSVQLFGDPAAPARTRTAVARLLRGPGEG
ncbi:TetR/AcrR family transcriptional regulator [Streptomyces sp. NPDC006733]|uniref:TetR/AcrR family transcriptional regulator n=1 Tax=Streptomyces sp. NPDC006733 TaxID=3155460 RepID=UPI0033E40DD3